MRARRDRVTASSAARRALQRIDRDVVLRRVAALVPVGGILEVRAQSGREIGIESQRRARRSSASRPTMGNDSGKYRNAKGGALRRSLNETVILGICHNLSYRTLYRGCLRVGGDGHPSAAPFQERRSRELRGGRRRACCQGFVRDRIRIVAARAQGCRESAARAAVPRRVRLPCVEYGSAELRQRRCRGARRTERARPCGQRGIAVRSAAGSRGSDRVDGSGRVPAGRQDRVRSVRHQGRGAVSAENRGR